MKKLLSLALLFSINAHAIIYTPGGGGGGAVDSVNGQTGVVVLDAADVNAVEVDGNTLGTSFSVGTKDNYSLFLKTNDTSRMFLTGGGIATFGSDLSNFTVQPTLFGTFQSQTTDLSGSFNAQECFKNYYGNSGNNNNCSTYRMSVRPGETYFTYSGDYAVLKADGYVSQPGVVNSFTASATAISTTNSGARLNNAVADDKNIINVSGIIREATGDAVSILDATGTDNSAHEAVGYDVARTRIVASGSSVSNKAIGIRINNNISASDTSPEVKAIESLSTAPSTFAGDVAVASLRINTAPSTATAVVSTHKVAVNINGVTYYLLMTNVP